MMSKIFGKHENKGFSFVEVLCAVAILSLVAGTIGTIIVVTARTYRKGVSETTIQQQAQLAANNISDIIKDACSIVYWDGDNGKAYENGEIYKASEDSSEDYTYSGSNTLDIMTNDNKWYRIVYNESTNQLYYKELQSDQSTETAAQVLIGNVSSFSIDTDKFASFKDSKSVTINMEVRDESTDRNIPLSYTMNSRNDIANVQDIASPDEPTIIFLRDVICLVPGENDESQGLTPYRIPLSVTGTYTDLEAYYTLVENGGDQYTGKTSSEQLMIVGDVTDSYVEVYVPKSVSNKGNAVLYLTVHTSDTKTGDDGVKGYLASAQARIYVRTVTDVSPKYTVSFNKEENPDGNREGKGAQYNFTATVSGNNLLKFTGYPTFDDNYKNAKAVYWSYTLTADGNIYTYASSENGSTTNSPEVSLAQSDDGKTKEGSNSYFKVTENSEEKFNIELIKDMPSDFQLTVTATSKHAAGVNKGAVYVTDESGKSINTGNTHYADVSGDITIGKLNTTAEYIMEPNQHKEFQLDSIVTSVNTSVLTYSYYIYDNNGNKQDYTPASGTTMTYSTSNKKIDITIGNDEKGNSTFEDITNKNIDPYTFYAEVKAGGTTIAKIIIHIRRIDYVHIKLESLESGDVKDGQVTYHFKVRYNSKTDGQEDRIIQYLINQDKNLYPDTYKQDIINALTVQLEWEIKDSSGSNDVDSKATLSGTDSENITTNGNTIILAPTINEVVIGDGWSKEDKDNNITGKVDRASKKITFKDGDNKIYVATIKYPLVRIYYEDAAMTKPVLYSMIQPPEIDITLYGTDKNTVTAKCKHTGTAGTPDLSAATNNGITGLANGKKLVIKATALHPFEGNNKADPVKSYVTENSKDEITDIYVLSTSAKTTATVVNDFKRGQGYTFKSDIWNGQSSFWYITDKYPKTGENSGGIWGNPYVVFRYRVVNDDGSTGDWSNFYDVMNENGKTYTLTGYEHGEKPDIHETSLFLPDKAYEIEFAKLVLAYQDDTGSKTDPNNMILVWPYNDDLKSALGIKYKSWNKVSEVGGKTSWDEFTETFYIGKVELSNPILWNMDMNTEIEGLPLLGKLTDSIESKTYSASTDANMYGDTLVYFSVTGLDQKTYNSAFQFKVNSDADYVKTYSNGNITIGSQWCPEKGTNILGLFSRSSVKYSLSGIYHFTVAFKPTTAEQMFYVPEGTTFDWKSTKLAVENYTYDIGDCYINY